MGQTGTSRAPIGAILALVGGALLAVGSYLPWAEISGGGQSASAKGVDGTDGYVTLLAGLLALLAGIMLTRSWKRGFAVLAVVAGLVGGGVGLYDALTAKDNALDAIAEELAVGVSLAEARDFLDEAIASGVLSITVSFGLYVVIGGGALALIGGLMSMKGSETTTTTGFAATSAPVPPVASSPPASTPPASSSPPMTEPPPPPEGGAP